MNKCLSCEATTRFRNLFLFRGFHRGSTLAGCECPAYDYTLGLIESAQGNSGGDQHVAHEASFEIEEDESCSCLGGGWAVFTRRRRRRGGLHWRPGGGSAVAESHAEP